MDLLAKLEQSTKTRIYAALRKEHLRFMTSLLERVLPKIEEDIEVILKNGWADAISPTDLYHCHLLISRLYPVELLGFESIISCDETALLYHSREYGSDYQTPHRNICSSLHHDPIAVNLKPILSEKDLASFSPLQINFAADEEDLNAHVYKFQNPILGQRYLFGIPFLASTIFSQKS